MSVYMCHGYHVRYVVATVQSLSRVQLFVTPWSVACQAPLSSTTSRSLLKFMFTESVMLSNHLILCCPLLILLSVLPSIWIFSNVLALCIRWPKHQSLMNIQGWFPLRLTGLTSLLSKGLSRVFSNTTVWKNQFSGAQSSLWTNSHIHTSLLEKP